MDHWTLLALGFGAGVIVGPYLWVAVAAAWKKFENWYLTKMFERMWK